MAVVSLYSSMVPQFLEAMSPEEHNRLYRMLHLSVKVNPDGRMDIGGTLTFYNSDNMP